MPRAEDLDDELFPPCHEDHVGDRYTDEYGVTYVCDLVEGLGYCWVNLTGPERRRDSR